MDMIWGVVLTGLTLIGWVGQLFCVIRPNLGEMLGLGEAPSTVDPIFYIDARGEAIWDSMILWTLPVAGILLVMQHPGWVYFGLVGGGCYIYYSGRNLVTRIILRRHGVRIGNPYNIRIAYLFLILWGLAAIITIAMAIAYLSG